MESTMVAVERDKASDMLPIWAFTGARQFPCSKTGIRA